MPRSRGSDRGAHAVRTLTSDSDPLLHRRSPRGTRIETRIADLESQLGQAQQELKSLKNQVSSAEDAKLEAQNELPLLVQVADKFQVKCTSKNVPKSNAIETKTKDIVLDDSEKEIDVFEVPVELAITEVEKPYVDELALKNDEIALLKSSLEYKWKEVESMNNENENLKNQLSEAVSKVSAAKTKEEGMILQLKQLGEESEANKANEDKLNEKLKCVEVEKFAFEFEMKKLRVQTEQWRKAADAAAAVLAGDVGIRIPERCGSMDKHFGATFETPAGRYNGYVGSHGMADDLDDDFGTGKRKGSRIRMFGDLWKKKGQK